MFNDLRHFRAAARASSFRQAARSLLITQPALTQAIQRLEAHTGHALFERRRTGVQLTAAGARLLAQADALLDQWDALGKDLSAADQRVQGRVVLGCHASVARYTLRAFLPSLLSKYPELDVRLVHDLSRVITDGVNAGPIDVGIVVNPFAFPDLVIRPLLKDEVAFWATRDATPGVLVCDPNLVQTQSLLRLTKKRFTRVIESSNLEVILALGEAGAGTVILPSRVVGKSRLRRINVTTPFIDRVCLVYRPAFGKSHLGRTVIEAIRTITE